MRQKKETFIQQQGQDYQQLATLKIAAGMKAFLPGIKVTKEKGFGRVAMAIYWNKKYRGKPEKESWYLLTNFKDLESA